MEKQTLLVVHTSVFEADAGPLPSLLLPHAQHSPGDAGDPSIHGR
jgi:hypothetical protein